MRKAGLVGKALARSGRVKVGKKWVKLTTIINNVDELHPLRASCTRTKDSYDTRTQDDYGVVQLVYDTSDSLRGSLLRDKTEDGLSAFYITKPSINIETKGMELEEDSDAPDIDLEGMVTVVEKELVVGETLRLGFEIGGIWYSINTLVKERRDFDEHGGKTSNIWPEVNKAYQLVPVSGLIGTNKRHAMRFNYEDSSAKEYFNFPKDLSFDIFVSRVNIGEELAEFVKTVDITKGMDNAEGFPEDFDTKMVSALAVSDFLRDKPENERTLHITKPYTNVTRRRGVQTELVDIGECRLYDKQGGSTFTVDASMPREFNKALDELKRAGMFPTSRIKPEMDVKRYSLAPHRNTNSVLDSEELRNDTVIVNFSDKDGFYYSMPCKVVSIEDVFISEMGDVVRTNRQKVVLEPLGYKKGDGSRSYVRKETGAKVELLNVSIAGAGISVTESLLESLIDNYHDMQEGERKLAIEGLQGNHVMLNFYPRINPELREREDYGNIDVKLPYAIPVIGQVVKVEEDNLAIRFVYIPDEHSFSKKAYQYDRWRLLLRNMDYKPFKEVHRALGIIKAHKERVVKREE
jgi:hypothetical protein